VKNKQRIAQMKRHVTAEMQQKYVEIGKELWARLEYRQKQIKRLKDQWKDPEYIKKQLLGNAGTYKSHYQGEYSGIGYQSLAELCFILWH
jgi:hypothetical protein